MDREYMRGDMRRLPPRNSRGEFRRRRSRRDRGMDYGYDVHEDMRGQYYRGQDYTDMPRRDRGRGDYGEYDMRQDYRQGGGMQDGHHPQQHGSTYYPIQAMGTFEGYYGMPEQDYARGGRGRQDYNYDMRGDYRRGRDYGYDYDDYGDYGETLTEQELEHWNKKLMANFDEREKQIFHKDAVMQRAKSMGKQMDGFGEKELYTATLMCYTDYKDTIGQNIDVAVKLAYDWLADKDVAVKGAEKLAVYHDCIVEGE